MKIFLVGGAVRDALLKLPVKDKDWVVVGATPNQMLDAGYQQVGRDFPVFLHPNSYEEYALARTERKSGSGYTGFTCYSAPDVTLEQDLQRRDLTINTLAQDARGRIIDVCGGLSDLHNRVLRHVSPSFSEDPLRVLRVARFAACYAYLDFKIAEETMLLMRNITASGELRHLTPERVWKETENALATNDPQVYFQTLRACGALRVLFPEIDVMFDISGHSTVYKYKEVNFGLHAMKTLAIAAKLSKTKEVRFSSLCHNFDKNLTQKHLFSIENNHILDGIQLVENVCRRLHIPNEIRNLAKLVVKIHNLVHSIFSLRSKEIIQLFYKIDAWRKPTRVEEIALASEAEIRGYPGCEDRDYPQSRFLLEAWEIAKAIQAKEIIKQGLKGEEIAEKLKKRRIEAIERWRKKYTSRFKY